MTRAPRPLGGQRVGRVVEVVLVVDVVVLLVEVVEVVDVVDVVDVDDVVLVDDDVSSGMSIDGRSGDTGVGEVVVVDATAGGSMMRHSRQLGSSQTSCQPRSMRSSSVALGCE